MMNGIIIMIFGKNVDHDVAPILPAAQLLRQENKKINLI